MILEAVAIAAAAPAGFALATTLYNLAVWPTGDPEGDAGGVSVLVPARDEVETIEACVRALLEAPADVDEVVVCDDGSSDGTREILDRLARVHDRLSVIEAGPLPDGWVGKPHACQRLSECASGDVLVYVDADTVVERGGLSRLVSLLDIGRTERAAMATAVPRQRVGSFAERLVLPLLHVTYTSWLPLPLVWRTDDPRAVAANGQLMALRRDALDAVGEFEAVRDRVVDDVALATVFKSSGRQVVFGDGRRMASCRMYEGFRQVWAGFSKNIFEGLGESAVLLAAVAGLYVTAFVAPYLGTAVWAGGLVGPEAGVVFSVGACCNVALRGVLVVTHGHPLEGPLVHPVGVLFLGAIAANSLRWARRNRVEWAGRSYQSRESRERSGEERDR